MSKQIDPQAFWDRKILGWEEDRYGDASTSGLSQSPSLKKFLGTSIQFRRLACLRIVAPHVAGKKVVEFGCGSGLTATELINHGASSYTGIDISPVAIENAKRIAERNGLADKTSFLAAPVSALDQLDGDIYFSLGFLDWLTPDQISHVFTLHEGKQWLHSISERQATAGQYLHRAYVFVRYGWRTKSYVPAYHAVDEIARLSGRSNKDGINVFRHPKLSFGALLTTLPIPELS